MKKHINLFMIGSGLVGEALIKYVRENEDYNTTRLNLNVRIVALANRTKMFFRNRGIELTNWKKHLNIYGESSDLISYFLRLSQFNKNNSVFVDCTDGNDIVPYYKKILKSFPIVTPNKSANSGSYSEYKALKKTAMKYGNSFRYSANVGVGLPTLDIINTLLEGGDEIYSIEGIFSSTLNYILNELFENNKPFSEIVRKAKELEITEPDPRNDLNGIDTARKILILAREAGAKLELSDIEILNLVPKNALDLKSMGELYNKLKSSDDFFDRLKRDALKNGKKIIYLAKYKNGKAFVKLVPIDSSHPFFNLSANEKTVAIKTKFFSKHPLIIKGQSGGADATAAVMFSDILKTIK